MQCFCVVFFLIFFIKPYVFGYSFEVDAILKGTTTYAFIKKLIKIQCCNLKTTELLDCAFIRACAVIRSNTVFQSKHMNLWDFNPTWWNEENCYSDSPSISLTPTDGGEWATRETQKWMVT